MKSKRWLPSTLESILSAPLSFIPPTLSWSVKIYTRSTMGRIHVLTDNVANKIAAGEVVERPASVVKELLENSIDAGASRIHIQVEGGGKKLIRMTDDGCGMVRDDAMLAFERYATSKIKDADDLLTISTLGFRGEALPSIASVSRMTLETCVAGQSGGEPGSRGAGTVIEIAGGKFLRVEDIGAPVGTSISVRDLFFNTPARKKFLKAESTEMSHIATLVTQYALAHPDKHFELHSATHAVLVAPPVAEHSERIYQVFGKELLDGLIPLAARMPLQHAGLPEPPPWRRPAEYQRPEPGEVRLHGFVSKPEIQKLNRNSIFVFVNRRLIRDRVVMHALSEAYRNILPPTVFPVVLLFLEMPSEEVDANVHPAKTEVRFRQQSFIHDFVRDSVRVALMKARPAPQFTREIASQPSASALSPGAVIQSGSYLPPSPFAGGLEAARAQGALLQPDADFMLTAQSFPPVNERLQFDHGDAIELTGDATAPAARLPASAELAGSGFSAPRSPAFQAVPGDTCGGAIDPPGVEAESEGAGQLYSLSSLKPLGQVRDSFILAVNHDGLWIVDQHVAHERILFEKILRQRAAKNGERVEGQRLLLPLIIALTPGQQAVFTEISGELGLNGFEVEPFGARTIAIKTAPAGLDAAVVERMLVELLDQLEGEQPGENLQRARGRIAASIACHAAIKVNMPLQQNKMEWLLAELARTECPMTCPHGRPVVLRYSVKEIQRAFKRI